MKGLIRCLLTLMLCTGWQHASAETMQDQNYRGGIITYINIATLELGIDNRLFELDSAFQIHGFGDGDRVQMLQELHPGMYVRYRTSEPEYDQKGLIEEILVPAN